jgi:SAM-dependent methyltransferase
MKSFDPQLELENWAALTDEPPTQEEMDALETDLRLRVPGSPGVFKGKRILDLSTDLGYYRLHGAAGFNGRLDTLSLVCGDVFHLPFSDASFDYIVANSFLHHLPDLNDAVREFTHLLRPGGYYFGREPNFNNPVVRFFVFGVKGTWLKRRPGISANEYQLRARQIRQAFAQARCACDLD